MKGIFEPGHCPATESCYHNLRYILDCRFHLHAINEATTKTMVGFLVLDSYLQDRYPHERYDTLTCEVFEIFKFYQGKGYGEAAVRALCNAATRHKTLELEPLESNEGFWLKCGFTYLTSHCMTIDLEPSASSD